MKKSGMIAIGIIIGACLSILFSRIWMQAVPPPLPTRLIPIPDTLDFNTCYVGQTSYRDLTYLNNSAQVADLVSAGTADAPFGFEAASFTAGQLQPQARIENLSFTFAPTAAGTFRGRGQVVPMPPGPQVNKVVLAGEGIYSESHGDLSITEGSTPSERSVEFGDVLLGQTKVMNVTVHNSNATEDRFCRVIFGGMSQAYTVTAPGREFTIPKNGSVSIQIQFQPSRSITYNSFIIVEYLRPSVADPTGPGVIPSADHYTGMLVRGRGIREE